MGFDGGVWYGQGNFDDKKDAELFYLEAKYRQRNGFGKPGFGSVTGYFLKKLVHYQHVIGTGNSYSINNYPFPIMRSEEHTSELQSLMRISYAVFCLKKTNLAMCPREPHPSARNTI